MEQLISVIIPVYNMEKFITECVNSFLVQTYSNIEIILIDDGSTDSSYKICEQLSIKDTRVKVLHQKNMGVSWATYNGLKIAKGDFICFADHDDVVMPNFLSHLIDKIDIDVDIVCCSRVDLHSHEIKSYKWDETEIFTQCNGREAVENTIKPVSYNLQLPLWGRLYRSSFLKKIDILKYSNFLPTIFMVDIFITPFILYSAKKIVYTNRVLYIHREVKTSISRSGKLSSFYFEMIDSYPILLKFYEDNKSNDLYDRTLKLYMNSCLLRTWYKLNSCKCEYNNSDYILSNIIEKFEYFYEKDIQHFSFLDKYSFLLFRKNKYLWKFLIGNIYFKFFRLFRILFRK